MSGMNNGDQHIYGMEGMNMSNSTGGMMMMMMMMHGHQMMMHMTFFWGKNAEILFSNWPGYDHLGMYILALAFIFVLAVIVEWLSHCNLMKESSNNVVVGLVQTLVYGIRIGLAYMVMLAVMSFNGGVFLVAITGHTLGFLFFGSRVFKKPPPLTSEKNSNMPPMSC